MLFVLLMDMEKTAVPILFKDLELLALPIF
jgi:hypothetical protein